jgi:hypothetical protein
LLPEVNLTSTLYTFPAVNDFNTGKVIMSPLTEAVPDNTVLDTSVRAPVDIS